MFFDCGSSAHGTEERDLRSKNNLETICFSQGSLKHSSSFMDHAYIYIYILLSIWICIPCERVTGDTCM